MYYSAFAKVILMSFKIKKMKADIRRWWAAKPDTDKGDFYLLLTFLAIVLVIIVSVSLALLLANWNIAFIGIGVVLILFFIMATLS